MAVTTTYAVAPVGALQPVNTTTAGNQLDAVAARLNTGNVAAVYHDFSPVAGGGVPRVLARLIGPTGAPLGAEVVVTADATSALSDTAYDTSVLANGNLVVVWRDGVGDLFYRLYDPSLAPLTGAVAAETASVVARSPSVAALAGGGFVVAYEARNPNEGDVRVARFSAAGALLADVILDSSTQNDLRPSVAALVGGGYAVAWERGSGSTAAWVAVYETNGTVRLAPIAFDSVGTTNASAEVIALASGGFVVAYEDNEYGQADATGARFASTGFFQGKTRLLNDAATNTNPHGAVSSDGYLALVTASQSGGGTALLDLQLPDGTFLATGVALTTGGAQSYADVAWADAGHLVVTSTVSGALGDGSGSGIGSALYEVRATITGDALANRLDGSTDGLVKTLLGLDGDDVLIGGARADRLEGGAGSDQLVGGAGADAMLGGLGDDYYYADDAADLITEGVNEGLDRVYATASYALSDNVEALFLQGSAVVGTGNGGDNTIIGTAGSNALYGLGGSDYLVDGGGADALVGGTGDDYYFVSALGGTITELAGEGFDRIFSTVSIVMADNVEALILQGAAVTGIGNAGDNGIIGNGLANVLSGGAGTDLLYGFGGADTFVFRAGYGADTIGDFAGAGAPGGDVLQIDPLLANSFAAFQAAGSQVGADAVYSFGGGTSLTLLNVNFAGLSSADVVFG